MHVGFTSGHPMTETASVESKRANLHVVESLGEAHEAGGAPRRSPLRDRVLEATDALVRDTGAVEGITMRRLAKRLRTSTTALYAEFPSKRALFAAARRRALLELREQLAAALADRDAFVALRSWIECYASRGYQDPWVAGLLTLSPGSAGADEFRDAADLIGLSGLHRTIEQVHRRGALAPGVSPKLATWLLWSGAHSLLVLRDVVVRHGDDVVHGPLVHRLAAAVVGGLVARAPVSVHDESAPPW